MANQANYYPMATARPNQQVYTGRTEAYSGAYCSTPAMSYEPTTAFVQVLNNNNNNNNHPTWNRPAVNNNNANQVPELFVNSVFKGDFAMSYAYLQQCSHHSHPVSAGAAGQQQQQQMLMHNTNSNTQPAMILSTIFRTMCGSPVVWDDRTSPVNTCKRTSSEIDIEPLKLANNNNNNKPHPAYKRARSCTIVEAPAELGDSVSSDGYDTELNYSSRCSSPLVQAVSSNISPRKPVSRSYRSLDNRALEPTKSPRKVKHGLGGERRLNIHFYNTGTLTEPIQTFGKYKLIIRDGLCGTHTMYAQPWKFEINQVDESNSKGEVRLRWSVTNTASDSRVTFVETTDQAHERQVKGNTICNLVVREALNKRALELEKELASLEPNASATRVAHLKSLIKELRPKQCTEGLLFFGLRHQAAQSRA